MLLDSIERAFRRFEANGDPQALAKVFDAAAPKLRGLAAHLSSPEASAEDLLQATFLTAIESKRTYDSTQPLLPWLAGILANHAREARRRNRRAIDPTRLREDVALDPSNEAESSELSQTLDSAISRLPEAYRSVLRLYLQHGLEPAEIARALDRPQGTVRAQLSRGLKRLRRLLPESLVASQSYALVSAARWAEIRSAVLGTVGGSAVPVSSGVLSFGFLAMTLNKKLLLVAAIVIAAFLTYSFRSELAAESAAKTANEIARAEVAPVVSAAPATAEPLLVVPARETLAQDPVPSATTSSPKTGSVHVHVTDSQDLPLAGVGLSLSSDTEMQNPASTIEFVLTDAGGNASFDGLRPTAFTVQTDRSMNIVRERIAAGETREIALRLGGVQVEGSVVDDAGRPVADAEIWAHGMRLCAAVIARSDEHGMFSVVGPSSGLALQARKAGLAPSKAHPVLGKEGESWKVQLALQGPASEVSGRVIDPDGAPVAGAFVAFARELSGPMIFDDFEPRERAVQARTAADGTFRVRDVPRGTMIATAVGRVAGWAPAAREIEVGAASEHIELQFPVGAILEGTLTENGKPRSQCSISVNTSKPDMPRCSLSDFLAIRIAQTDRRGHFRIVGIVPGEVEVTGRPSGLYSPSSQKISVKAGEKRQLDIDLSTSPGASFEFTVEPATSPANDGFWWVRVVSDDEGIPNVSIYPLEGRGRFTVARLAPGRYSAVVCCQPEMGDLLPMFGAKFDAADGRLDLRVPADRMHLQPVRGRVVDSSRIALKERTVQLRSGADLEPFVLKRASGLDGSFSFAGVPPGNYSISMVDGDSTKVLREFTVVADHAAELGDVTPP